MTFRILTFWNSEVNSSVSPCCSLNDCEVLDLWSFEVIDFRAMELLLTVKLAYET